MYSPSHWAEISLHFMGFKNRVFLLLFLICCCIGRFLNLFFFKLSFGDKVGFCRIWDSWNIAAGVLWNSACCEHWLTTLSSASSPLVAVQVNKIPLFPRMLWVRTSAGTKKHFFQWSCANLHQIRTWFWRITCSWVPQWVSICLTGAAPGLHNTGRVGQALRAPVTDPQVWVWGCCSAMRNELEKLSNRRLPLRVYSFPVRKWLSPCCSTRVSFSGLVAAAACPRAPLDDVFCLLTWKWFSRTGQNMTLKL